MKEYYMLLGLKQKEVKELGCTDKITEDANPGENGMRPLFV